MTPDGAVDVAKIRALWAAHGFSRTHWEDCEYDHPGCAAVKVCDAYGALLARLVALERERDHAVEWGQVLVTAGMEYKAERDAAQADAARLTETLREVRAQQKQDYDDAATWRARCETAKALWFNALFDQGTPRDLHIGWYNEWLTALDAAGGPHE